MNTVHVHSLDDWLAMICIAVSGAASFSSPYFLFVDADLADFDPRPAVSRTVESGRVDALLVAVGPALYAVRQAARLSLRDAAVSAAALLALLLPAPEATR